MAEILLGRLVGPSGFERPVVIKRILPHLAREESFVSMFLDEARIVAGIRHPNVVQVQEAGQEGGELFLAMEYLEGETASGLLKRLIVHDGEKLVPTLAAHIVAEACAGLHAAHELTDAEGEPINLVHRDVSPQNLFVTYAGQVKLLDFGIAKAADRITRTETGIIKGKHEYMSPEQCVGKPLDRRSDIFALGVVLFELLSGKRLFKRENQMAALYAICNEPIPSLLEVAPWVDARLEAVCMRALARKRDERFATALELRHALLTTLQDLSVRGDLGEDLSALMKRMFSDRIASKREMLRRVRSGTTLTSVPRGEVDLSVDIPIVTVTDSGRTGATASRWETVAITTGNPPAPPRPSRGLLVATLRGRSGGDGGRRGTRGARQAWRDRVRSARAASRRVECGLRCAHRYRDGDGPRGERSANLPGERSRGPYRDHTGWRARAHGRHRLRPDAAGGAGSTKRQAHRAGAASTGLCSADPGHRSPGQPAAGAHPDGGISVSTTRECAQSPAGPLTNVGAPGGGTDAGDRAHGVRLHALRVREASWP